MKDLDFSMKVSDKKIVVVMVVMVINMGEFASMEAISSLNL